MRRFLAAALLLLPVLAARPAVAAGPRIEISLDPRLELLGAVQVLSTSTAHLDGFLRRDVPAVRELSRLLAPAAAHPAVAASGALDPKAFTYFSRADLFLRLSPPPALAPSLMIPDLLVSEAGGPEGLAGWLDSMRAFARDAGFPAYFAKERDLLAAPVAAFRGPVEKEDYVGKIERYTGLPFDGRYSVRLSPFVKMGSQVNAVVLRDDGSYDIQSVVGPEVRGGTLDFRPDEFPGTAWHELGHGLLDTLSDLNQDRINRNSELENKLESRWNCYGGSWEQCVKEHVVRAVMIRLIALNFGQEAADRRLREEGEDKFPYLKPMLDSLRFYEAHRDEYPTIADYFPRLLDVFPKPPAPARVAPLPPLASGDPGPNWVMQSVRPFATAGQRARALKYANLTRAPSAALRRMRAALELLAGQDAPAAKDAAELFASDPGDSGAALIAVSAALKRGDEAGARRVRTAALARCRAASDFGDADRALACRSLGSLPRPFAATAPSEPAATAPSEPAAAASPAPSAAAEAEPRVGFAIDPRVELLSVVTMLAYPSEFDALFPDGKSAYAQDALSAFGAMKDDPAISMLRSVVERSSQPNLPAELLLSASPAPELKPSDPSLVESFDERAGGPGTAASFLAALRDFSRRSDFPGFYARHEADYRAFVAAARADSSRQFPASAAADYLRAPFPATYRFVLSPLLPARFDSNSDSGEGAAEIYERMRSAVYYRKVPSFDFESFGAGVAHELIHTLTDPLASRYEDEINSYGGEAPKDCADTWTGCVREQVVFAVTLRILHRLSGDAAYRAQLDDSVRRGFPQLPALCERLKEYEAAPPAGGFAAFYPRLVDVFREALEKSIHDRAVAASAFYRALPEGSKGAPPLDPGALAASEGGAAGASGAAEASAAEPAGKASVVFSVDPRVELAGLLLTLSDARGLKPDGAPARAARAFSAFSRHPAVAEAAAIEKRSGQAGFVVQLFARLSDPPGLAVAAPIPGSIVKQAGGRELVLKFLEDSRDFARRSDFMRFFEASRPAARLAIAEARDEFARAMPPAAAEQYLGVPFRGVYTVALTSLLPGDPQTLVVPSGDDERSMLVRSAGSAAAQAGFGLDTFGNSLTHELIHTVTNPLVAALSNKAAPPPGCNDHGGASWSACIQEHLVYAVELRVMAQTLGEKVYRRTAERWAQRGFPYLLALGDALKDYEADRARYPSIREFYPRLEAALERKLPADPNAPAREAARRAKDRGVAAFLKGENAAAERAFLAAAKADPDDAETFLDLGVLEAKLGNSAKAHEYYARAIEKGSRSPAQWQSLVSALTSRAELWESEKKPDEARADLQRALGAAPADWSERPGVAERLKRLSAP